MSSLLCAEPLFRAAGTGLNTLPRVPGVWKKAFEEEAMASFGVCGVCKQKEKVFTKFISDPAWGGNIALEFCNNDWIENRWKREDNP